MAPKPTGGGKIGTGTLGKRSPGAVLEKHGKSMRIGSENERFLMASNHCMCETVPSKRAFASFGKSRKIDGERTPKSNEIWAKMEPGAPKGRLCQGPGRFWRDRKNCVFSRGKRTTKNPEKWNQNAPRADFVAPGDRQPVGAWCIFGQEVPGAASRARYGVVKQWVIGAGSDTPWAAGPANLLYGFSFFGYFYIS